MSQSPFEAIIGIEIHAQISTVSKMFCSCSSDAFFSEPNQNVCPICMGFPGQLPVINAEAVRLGTLAAMALNFEIQKSSKFDRKNYFYPDLPKGYQISQFDKPLALRGHLEVKVGDEVKRVNITRLHLEDDAGKLTHTAFGTLCDYNRSGIALMEIVSEPDLRTSQEAVAYLKMVQSILRSCGASNADMEKGMMRFDASVSIREKGEKGLRPRAEIKNLNSFRSVESAIDYEIQRQIELANEQKSLDRDVTVGWNEIKQATYFLRDKEGADDYRYFPEPDLPPLLLEDTFLDEIRRALPELPDEKMERYMKHLGLSEAEALLIAFDTTLAKYFEQVVETSGDAKKSSMFVTSILLGRMYKEGIEWSDLKVKPQDLGRLIVIVNQGEINLNNAKNEVFEEMFISGKAPELVIEEKGFKSLNDTGLIEEICQKIITDNPQSVADYQQGKQAALMFLVGKVMKETKGQANASMVTQTLTNFLKK